MILLSQGNKLASVRVLLLAIFAVLVVRPATRKAGLLAMLSWPLANLFCDALKYGFQMPRPSVELADAIVRVDRLTSFGTASAHAANMMAVATVFLYFHRWWGTPWLVVALATGYSRVFVGVHYPYQVLLGWAVGAVSALILIETWSAFRRVYPKRSAPLDESPAGDP